MDAEYVWISGWVQLDHGVYAMSLTCGWRWKLSYFLLRDFAYSENDCFALPDLEWTMDTIVQDGGPLWLGPRNVGFQYS